MSEVNSSFKILRAGSQVFSLLMLFLCVILNTMWSGKRLQLPCIFKSWYVMLVCHQYYVCKNYVGSVYVGGLSESGLCDLCPVGFLVVGESPPVL